MTVSSNFVGARDKPTERRQRGRPSSPAEAISPDPNAASSAFVSTVGPREQFTSVAVLFILRIRVRFQGEIAKVSPE